jgi:hypothetical protein
MEPASSGLQHPEFRRWQFEASMMKAAAAGNLDVVKLLVTHFKKYLVTAKVVNEAAKHDHIEILTWVHGQCQFVDWSKEAVYFAVQAGHLEMAKWLQANIVTPPLNVLIECAVAIAKRGDLELLKWVCSLDVGLESGARITVNPWQVVKEAVDFGHLEMLKWIFEQPIGTEPTLDEGVIIQEELVVKIHAWQAVRCGHFDVLKWLVPKHRKVCFFEGADAVAAETGRLDTLCWLWANNLVTEPSMAALSKAAQNGHLHILEWMADQEQRYDCGKSMYEAARNGHVQVVQWLYENTSASCTMDAMDAAATHGHLDIVKLLHANGPPVRSMYFAMMGAATYGHLDIVKFLHGTRRRECHVDARAAAVEHGKLEVAKWLHFNTELSNSNIAAFARLDMPARSGDLETIQWCHAQGFKGFTTDVMNAAAGSGHLDIVKWLHANRAEGCTTYAMDVAASNDHLGVVK